MKRREGNHKEAAERIKKIAVLIYIFLHLANNFSFKNKILSVTVKSMDEVTEQTHCHELCC